jgi:hypothetical protein
MGALDIRPSNDGTGIIDGVQVTVNAHRYTQYLGACQEEIRRQTEMQITATSVF